MISFENNSVLKEVQQKEAFLNKMEPTQEESKEIVEFEVDLKEVDKQIRSKAEYTDERIRCRFHKANQGKDINNDKERKYISSIKTSFRYTGVLNANLQRNDFGVNFYNNGDAYLGYWKENKRTGYGVYVHAAESNEIKIHSGYWNEGVRVKNGIHLWKKSSDLKKSLKKENFDAVIGDFSEGQMKQGVYLSQSIEEPKVKRFAYKGNFVNGLKHDDRGMYYQFHDKKLIIGRFQNDQIIEGFLMTLKEDDTIDLLVMFEEVGGTMTFTRDVEIPNNIKVDIINKAVEFRTSLIKNDFFNLVEGYFDNLIPLIERYDSIDNYEKEELNDLAKYQTMLDDIYKRTSP